MGCVQCLPRHGYFKKVFDSSHGPSAIPELLLTLREQVKLRRIFLEDDFQDFDRVKRGVGECDLLHHVTLSYTRGVVTSSQFCRVLTDVALLDQQNNELAASLIARYSTTLGVNYKRFLEDLNH